MSVSSHKQPHRILFCDSLHHELLKIQVIIWPDASEERLIREIMTVDNIEWDEAKKTFLKIEAVNANGMNFSTLPYKVGKVRKLLFWYYKLYLTSHIFAATYIFFAHYLGERCRCCFDRLCYFPLMFRFTSCTMVQRSFCNYWCCRTEGSRDMARSWLVDMELDGASTGATEFFPPMSSIFSSSDGKNRFQALYAFS